MSVKIAIFISVSIILALISWRTFSSYKSHGFFRFFAWETMLVILLINIDAWFIDIYSVPQLISWTCLSISFYLVLDSVYLIYTAGKPSSERKDKSLLALEKTTHLVTFRIYRFIRHPMYSSLIFLTWGMFFKNMSWPVLALAVLSTVFLVVSALREEKENIAYFGDEYMEYMSKTNRFIPYII